MGTDGVAWARELAAALNGAGYNDGTADIDPTPGGLLHVWVANAIEAGRSAGYSQGAAEAAEHAREQGEGLAADLEHEGWADMAVAVRHRLAGGAPLNGRDSGLPANPAGSELAADSAGSALAANPAGSDALARMAEALERSPPRSPAVGRPVRPWRPRMSAFDRPTAPTVAAGRCRDDRPECSRRAGGLGRSRGRLWRPPMSAEGGLGRSLADIRADLERA
jgi:hypothetical protein